MSVYVKTPNYKSRNDIPFLIVFADVIILYFSYLKIILKKRITLNGRTVLSSGRDIYYIYMVHIYIYILFRIINSVILI